MPVYARIHTHICDRVGYSANHFVDSVFTLINSYGFRSNLRCQVYTLANGQEDWTRYPYRFKDGKARFSHVSVQLFSISEKVLVFGRFPGFDRLSFRQEQHVDARAALVERYSQQNTRRDPCLSCHFVRNKSHMFGPGIEIGTARINIIIIIIFI